MVDTVVLWGISLLPHARQWEDCLKSGLLHLRVWRLAIVVHLALLSKMNVWSTAWENAVCVKCGHVRVMRCLLCRSAFKKCIGNSKDKELQIYAVDKSNCKKRMFTDIRQETSIGSNHVELLQQHSLVWSDT